VQQPVEEVLEEILAEPAKEQVPEEHRERREAALREVHAAVLVEEDPAGEENREDQEGVGKQDVLRALPVISKCVVRVLVDVPPLEPPPLLDNDKSKARQHVRGDDGRVECKEEVEGLIRLQRRSPCSRWRRPIDGRLADIRQ